MPRSINAKLLLMVAAIMGATALAVAYITGGDLSQSLARQDEQTGRNLLTLSKALIEDEFNAYLDARLLAVLDARKEMRNQTQLVAAMVDSYRELADRNVISHEKAKALALDWIGQRRESLGQLFFVFDDGLTGLSHDNPALVGRSFAGLTEDSGHDALQAARDLARANGEANFMFRTVGGSQPARQYLGYLVSYPAWGWYICAGVDIGEIEVMLDNTKEASKKRLRDVFSRVRLGESGHVVVFDKDGFIYHPDGAKSPGLDAVNAVTGHALLDDFKRAALTPGVPARYQTMQPDGSRRGESRIVQMDYFKPWDWYLGVTISEDELYAPKRLLLGRQFAVIAAIGLIGLAVAFIVARRIIRPLGQLTENAVGLPQGDFSNAWSASQAFSKLAAENRDEVGALARAMSVMLGVLSASIARLTEADKAKQDALDETKRARDELSSLNVSLEEQVAERTRDLSRINEALLGEMRRSESLAESLRDNQARLLEAQRIARLVSFEYFPEGGRMIWSGDLQRLIDHGFEASPPGIADVSGLLAAGDKAAFAAFCDPKPGAPPNFYSLVSQTDEDGEERLFEIRAERRWLGREMALAGTVQDLTEEKRRQRALWRAELTVAALLDAPRDIFMILDPSGVILQANSVLSERFGLPLRDLIGKNVFDLMPPEVSKLRWENTAKAVARKAPVYFSDANAGDHFDSAVYPVTDERGEVIQVVVHAKDMTTQRALAQKLQENEALYRLLAENTMDIISLHDEMGRFRYVSPAVAAVMGYDPEELVGRFITEFIHPEDAADAQARIAAQVDNPGLDDVVYRIRHKDGRYVWLATKAKAIVAADTGRYSGFTAASRDFTEHMRLGEQLKASHEKLELRVAERTLELRKLNRMLRKEAGERRQAEDNIRTLSQQLLSAQENERRRISRDLHDDIAQNLSSLKIKSAGLLTRHQIHGWDGESDLVEISRILQNTIDSVRGLSFELLPSVLEQFGLVEAVTQLCHNFIQDSAKPTGKAVDCEFTARGVEGAGLDYETQINIYRLIQEGLSNIRRHAGAKRADIALSVHGRNLALRIKDDGVGFDAGSQLAKSLRNRRMGLWSMKSRVELLQGVMEIKTAPGKGTAITIAIPVKRTPSKIGKRQDGHGTARA